MPVRAHLDGYCITHRDARNVSVTVRTQRDNYPKNFEFIFLSFYPLYPINRDPYKVLIVILTFIYSLFLFCQVFYYGENGRLS